MRASRLHSRCCEADDILVVMFIIAALGNPGAKYEKTRHNAAWIVLNEIAGDLGWEESKYAKALVKKSTLEGETVEFLKPLTFMNRSGESVRYSMDKNNLSPEKVIVLHDEVALPLGEFKISTGKGAGGHNGVASVIHHLKGQHFIRVRIGVAPTTLRAKFQKATRELAGYVLSSFFEGEIRDLKKQAKDIQSALALIMSGGATAAMNKWN